MAIAYKWIQLGYAIKTVLRIVGLLEATYYARRKNQGKPKVYNGGRPVPGHSMKTNGHPVADEQIKEWIHEYLADEEAAYGYRKITVCLRRDFEMTRECKFFCVNGF